MVGTFCGGGFWTLGVDAAALVVATNLFLRPPLRRLNSRPSVDEEDGRPITQLKSHAKACKGIEEAYTRLLLLDVLLEAGLGLRRLGSEDIPDISKVSVTAQAVAIKRNDSALERVVGRLSLEPHVSGATWQVDRTISDT